VSAQQRQDVRQAMLIVHPEFDDSQVAEQLALFDGASGQPYPFSGEAWRDIPDSDMQNGWTHLDGNPQPQFRKRPNGHVELRGVVSGGEIGVIFNLPEGYRHNYGAGIHFPVVGQRGVAHVYVHPNGDVVMANTFQGAGDWFGLASIIFSNS